MFYPHGYKLIHIKAQETEKVLRGFILAEMHSAWTEGTGIIHIKEECLKVSSDNRASFS